MVPTLVSRFGVRESLVVDFEKHEAGTAIDGRRMNRPYHVAHYDCRLIPTGDAA